MAPSFCYHDAAAQRLCSTAAWAQFNAGIQGTVADASGAVIAGAKVTLVNTETGRKSEATASSDGLYRFSSLAPGAYKLTVEREGFKKKGIGKNHGQRRRRSPALMW